MGSGDCRALPRAAGRPCARGLPAPGVQEDELHVKAGAEHEHVAMQLDLGDRARRQRVAHRHQAHVLVAAVKGGHVQAVLADLQIAAAVNDLYEVGGGVRLSGGQQGPQKDGKGVETC